MTIYEIKKRVEKTSPFFFDRKTLKFFKQTLKDFHVRKIDNCNYYIWAYRTHGKTERIFNTCTNELESL